MTPRRDFANRRAQNKNTVHVARTIRRRYVREPIVYARSASTLWNSICNLRMRVSGSGSSASFARIRAPKSRSAREGRDVADERGGGGGGVRGLLRGRFVFASPCRALAIARAERVAVEAQNVRASAPLAQPLAEGVHDVRDRLARLAPEVQQEEVVVPGNRVRARRRRRRRQLTDDGAQRGAASASASSTGESPFATPGGRRNPTKDFPWWIFARSRRFVFVFVFVFDFSNAEALEKSLSRSRTDAAFSPASASATHARVSASTENGACSAAAVSKSRCLSGNRATSDASEHRRLHSRAAPVTIKSSAKRSGGDVVPTFRRRSVSTPSRPSRSEYDDEVDGSIVRVSSVGRSPGFAASHSTSATQNRAHDPSPRAPR